jgi:hypothetical protein
MNTWSTCSRLLTVCQLERIHAGSRAMRSTACTGM